MPYFIFNKNSSNSIFKIAENEEDLNLINGIQQDCYLKIISTENDFNDVKLNKKFVFSYNGSSIEVANTSYTFTREMLKNYLENLKENIELFLENNSQHPRFQIWSNYLNYLNTIIINVVIPTKEGLLKTSLEEYIQSQGKTFYSLLQLP